MYFALWQASAVDIDHGTNAELRYTIVNNNDAGPFLINSTSGEIFTVGKLDWETQEFYSIQVSKECPCIAHKTTTIGKMSTPTL